jgi:hypothetical protein
MFRKFGITVTVLSSLTVLTLLMHNSSQNAVALPANRVTTTYYKTADMKTKVGSFTLYCNGKSVMKGHETDYSSDNSSPCNPSPRSSGGSELPCEFLAEGCPAFPQKR